MDRPSAMANPAAANIHQRVAMGWDPTHCLLVRGSEGCGTAAAETPGGCCAVAAAALLRYHDPRDGEMLVLLCLQNFPELCGADCCL